MMRGCIASMQLYACSPRMLMRALLVTLRSFLGGHESYLQLYRYNLTDLHYKAGLVEGLINHELAASPINGVKTNVLLAGFSEGAQMTGYMQLAHLDYALGGAVVMDGFPLPPLQDMAAPGVTPAAAKANATYYGQDMRWMIWWGSEDPIFPADLSIKTFTSIFDVLGIKDTLKIEHVEPGMTHAVIEKEFVQMMRFVRGGI